MYEKLQKIRAEKEAGERGFTLIELLVVVVIIGILVAIAIPLYLSYRQGAENKSVESDIRNAVPSIEQFYSDAVPNAYPLTLNNSTAPAATNVNVHLSSGNDVEYNPNGTAPASYILCGQNSDTKKLYVYNSDSANGTVHASTEATMALCLSNGD